MSYIDPHIVLPPRSRVGSVDVLYNDGPGSWSIARLTYDDQPDRRGIRCNGSDEEAGIGNPQSRGKPIWFVVPEALSPFVRDMAEERLRSRMGSPSSSGLKAVENAILLPLGIRRWTADAVRKSTHLCLDQIPHVNRRALGALIGELQAHGLPVHHG